MLLVYVLISLVLLMMILAWVMYNGLVSASNVVDEAFSGIDVQLKKRFELIPNLIEAVKGYNAHEAETLQKIVENRSGMKNGEVTDVARQDESITGALRSFRIQVEAYPELLANLQFLKLMDNLSMVENELAMARRYYNGAVRDYNTKIESFPNMLIAKPFGFKIKPFYIVEETQRATPIVDLSE